MTGGGGFIGARLVPRLVDAGAVVTLLGPPAPNRPEVRQLVDAGAVAYWPTALVGEADALRDPLRGCDSLIHLGYQFPRASEFWARLAEELTTNLLATVRLLQVADQAEVGFVGFASSVAVYASTARGITEDGQTDGAATPYGLAKLLQEACVQRWARLTHGRAAILRLATVYGPGETVGRAIPSFIRAVLEGRSPVVEGHGTLPFDVIFVDDVVEAFLSVLERRADGVFNIGTGVGRAPREIAALVTGLCDARLEVVENLGVPERGGPICDVSRAASELGFRAGTPLEAGLRVEIESWQHLAGATVRRAVTPVPMS